MPANFRHLEKAIVKKFELGSVLYARIGISAVGIYMPEIFTVGCVKKSNRLDWGDRDRLNPLEGVGRPYTARW